jgi:hypothetical protein
VFAESIEEGMALGVGTYPSASKATVLLRASQRQFLANRMGRALATHQSSD